MIEQEQATPSPWHACIDQCDKGHKYDWEPRRGEGEGGGGRGRVEGGEGGWRGEGGGWRGEVGTKLLLRGSVRTSDSHKTILKDCEGGSGKCLPSQLEIVTVLPFV